MIIGLAAKKQRGKDTMADYLVEHHGFEKLSFAAPMKASGAAALGVSVDLLDSLKENPLARVQLVEIMTHDNDIVKVHADISVRQYWQKVGTEAHRSIPEFGEHVWIQMMHDKLLDANMAGRDVVIIDARFANEQRLIRTLGGWVVQIDRPGMPDGDGHPSEQVDHGLADFSIVNDSSLDDFYLKVEDALGAIRRDNIGVL